MLRDFASEQNRGALAFIIAKIGTVLAVACERGEFGREAARDLGWIGEPQILIGLEPAETVADHDASAGTGAHCGCQGVASAEAANSADDRPQAGKPDGRSEEHTSELQSLMRTSYAVFCLQKKK